MNMGLTLKAVEAGVQDECTCGALATAFRRVEVLAPALKSASVVAPDRAERSEQDSVFRLIVRRCQRKRELLEKA